MEKMIGKNAQQQLSQHQLQAFYHDNFVESQVRDFLAIVPFPGEANPGVVVDVGGGRGYFAKAIRDRTGLKVRVLDTDIESVSACRSAGIDAKHDDAINPTIFGDERVVCFNLILHHLVGATEHETYGLQGQAVAAWRLRASAVFVNEYIYESFVVPRISGVIIYWVTRSRILSSIAGVIARVAPSLKANTFNVGVRFRTHAEWSQLFSSLGFVVADTVIGMEEHVSLPRRLLLIRKCRRDSFVLLPRG